MKCLTDDGKLRVHFLPLDIARTQYKCVTSIRTPHERCWGFVFFEGDKQWTNSRGDGKVYRNRNLAGRDLVDRPL